MSESLCFFACLSGREHISRTTRLIFTIFVHVTAVVFTLYNPLYDRLRRTLQPKASICLLHICYSLLLLLFADNQVMQSMHGVVADVDVSSGNVAEV